ncbi:fucose-specific lectin [Annulohypoxylon moriforme]|nr:fucose-specific lectin [Annulohypoxylon moriforme]
MASANFHYGQQDQPGLEVVHNGVQYDSGLEVKPGTGLEVNQPYLPPILAAKEQEEKEVAQVGIKGNGPNSLPRKWSVKRIILIAVCSTIIIVAVVVGAVLGSRKSRAPSTTNVRSDQGGSEQGDIDTGLSSAEMTGTPTSVTAGLAPTAISWGYPHLEIFALTNNVTQSVYRKYRNVNATSDMDFVPSGTRMELVGGGVNTYDAPSISVNHRITSEKMNRTEVHINGDNFGYNKFHDANQIWDNTSPNTWNYFQRVNVIGGPAEAKYDPSVEVMKVFYLAKGDNGINANYFQWHPQDNWTNLIPISGPDLQPFTPAVVAWNGNDTRLDIFAVSRANSHLLHASWNAAESTNWTDYEDLHGCVTTPPVAISRAPGIIDVFARGGDAGLWHLSYDDSNKSWSNWTRISGNTTIQAQPDAISIDSGSLDVFAQGTTNTSGILHKRYDSTSKTWTPKDGFDELEIENGLAGPPKAVSDAPSRIHVFAYDVNGILVWKTLDQSGENIDPVKLARVPMITWPID